MTKMTDQELLKKIRSRDEKTIVYLRELYYPMIKYMVENYKYSDNINLISGNQADIEDIMHDTFYIMMKKISNEDFAPKSKLVTYFYGVSKNLLRSKLQKRLVELKHTDKVEKTYDTSINPENLYDRNLRKNAFDYYLNKLSGVCKEILNFYWLSYSVAEIADRMENTKKYIMKRKYECQKRLIKLIKENPDNY